MSCRPDYHKYISTQIFFTGNMCYHDAIRASSHLKDKTKIHHVNWCLTGMNLSLDESIPVTIDPIGWAPRTGCMLANSTAIIDPLEKLNKTFNTLFAFRSFFHWYVLNGMEDG